MPATSQDVIAFKAQFPAFISFNDADISTAFDFADVFTDPTQWNPATYVKARLLWVANQLMVMRMMGGLALPGGLLGSLTVMGDLYVRERRFGERAVSYDQRQIFKNIAAGSSVGDAALSLTIFGIQYLTLRNRTFPAVLVV